MFGKAAFLPSQVQLTPPHISSPFLPASKTVMGATRIVILVNNPLTEKICSLTNYFGECCLAKLLGTFSVRDRAAREPHLS